MEATFYVYAYLLLSFIYVAGSIAYMNSVSRTASLAKARQEPDWTGPPPEGGDTGTRMRPTDFATDEAREQTQTAVRAVLSADSAAFACAVVPVAYLAVTGLLGTLISRSPGSAGAINPLWLASTAGVVVAHMLFLTRIIAANSKIKDAQQAVLTASFVRRHRSMLTYYRLFLGLVTLFVTANSIFLLANLGTVVKLPYVGF